MIKHKQFYVYVTRDPRPGKAKAPIYVGKGTSAPTFTCTLALPLARECINAPASKLPALARKYGYTPAELRAAIEPFKPLDPATRRRLIRKISTNVIIFPDRRAA
jgi:hypothetical protein